MTIINMNITMELLYLVVMLIIIRRGISSISSNSRYINLYLLIISLIINFVFNRISVITFIESIISISLVLFYDEIYRIVRNINNN